LIELIDNYWKLKSLKFRINILNNSLFIARKFEKAFSCCVKNIIEAIEILEEKNFCLYQRTIFHELDLHPLLER
jgi:hypothetical protein